MHFIPRIAFLAIVSVTLAGCGSASSAGSMLAAPFSLLGRTLGSVLPSGGSAAVTNPDTSSEAVAERGKMIQERGDSTAPGNPAISPVAQR